MAVKNRKPMPTQHTENILRLSTDEKSVLEWGQYRHRVDELNSLTGERTGVVGWFTTAHKAKTYVLATCSDRLNWQLEYRITREYWQQSLGGF